MIFVPAGDNCVNNPCQNGTCAAKVKGYECICHPGYTGRNCDEEQQGTQ